MASRSGTEDRSHLSIGEVLSLLQEEYPDVTISKIRFLESQGLLDPERTPSGYRKFYEADIERLRWILRQQKDHFLPLKVIKDRLAAGELEPPPDPAADPPPAEVTTPAGEDGAASTPEVGSEEAPAPAQHTGRGEEATKRSRTGLLDVGETSVSLSSDELCEATGLSVADVAELERFGLVQRRTLGDAAYYDEEALVVGRLAAAFGRLGVEARHLRMFKVAADREAGFYEQLVVPRLKQRRPGARQAATDLLEEAADLGDQLHGALLRRALRDALRPT